MTSRRYRRTRPAGVIAWFDGQCWMCDRPITRHNDLIVERKGEWIHVGCNPGGSDE